MLTSGSSLIAVHPHQVVRVGRCERECIEPGGRGGAPPQFGGKCQDNRRRHEAAEDQPQRVPAHDDAGRRQHKQTQYNQSDQRERLTSEWHRRTLRQAHYMQETENDLCNTRQPYTAYARCAGPLSVHDGPVAPSTPIAFPYWGNLRKWAPDRRLGVFECEGCGQFSDFGSASLTSRHLSAARRHQIDADDESRD